MRTGKLVWTFHTVPHPGEFGYETWPAEAWKTSGGVHNWNEMTHRRQARHRVIFRFGTASYDFYGADRKGDDLFGNSLVALMPAPASACGISRPCITTCGITIYPPRPSCSP